MLVGVVKDHTFSVFPAMLLTFFIEVNRAIFILLRNNYTKVITTNETITIREKISDLLGLLPKQDFLRVHKSFAVATIHIKSIEGNRIFISDHTIPIGKMYKNNVNQLLN